MAKKKESVENVVVEYADLSGLLPWITQLAFFLSLALVIARCTMMETLRDATPVTPGATVAPAGPGAASILFLNLLCCVPAILILLRRALDKTYYLHSSIAHLLAGIVGVWAVISTAWAGDKYAAFINSSALVAAAAMFWSMTQLVRSWSRLRFVSAACFSVFLLCIAQGVNYHYVDQPDMTQRWKEMRTEVFRSHGWNEDSFIAQQFERKVLNGEMVGFYTSSNSMAAMLVFMGFVTVGLAIQRIVNKDEWGWATAITGLSVPALVVILWTQSKTAYVTPTIAGVILALLAFRPGYRLTHCKTVFWSAAGLVVLASLAVIGHGLFHHSLPTDSLNFRWRFWTGSWGVFKSSPWLGTGWANFGLHYLQFRLPEASEEIKDPHNFIVRLFCELGIGGGILALALLIRSAWELTVPATPPAPSAKLKAPGKLSHSFRQIVPIVLLALLINIGAVIDFHGNSDWTKLQLLYRLLWGGLMLLAFALATLRSSKDPSIDDRPAPWLLYSILVGITIFILHNTIDFSMFENGPMLMLALLGGAVIGTRNAMKLGQRKRSLAAGYLCAAATIAWCAILIAIAVPISEAESRVRDADMDVRQRNLNLAAAKYKDAFYSTPIRNTDFAVRAAEVYAQMPDSEAPFLQMVSEALGRNPKDLQAPLLLARYYISRGDSMNKSTQIQKAYRSALANDPNNVAVRLEYAQFLSTVFESQNAVGEFERALSDDDKLDKAEPKRLSEAKKEEIRKQIKELRGE